MRFDIDVADEGAVLRVSPRGEIDLRAAPKLLACFESRVRPKQAIDVDLARVPSVDPSALAVFIEGKNLAARSGSTFRLLNVAGPVLDVIRMARLTRFFTIVPAPGAGTGSPPGAPSGPRDQK